MKLQRKNYTLLEMIAVIMLLLLVAGVVTVQFRKHPAFISLDRQLNEIKSLCSEARNSACCQGKTIIVELNLPTRKFSVKQEKSTEEEESEEEQSKRKFSAFTLLEDMELSIGDKEINLQDEQTVELFKFFPDGSGMAQNLSLKLGKHQWTLKVSPLTGCISTHEEKQNE